MEKTSAEKLSALRALISQAGLDGLIVPHTDEYRNEYLPPESKRLEWLTGFTGSAGYAVILADKAAVASDGRYFPIQLRAQVDESAFQIIDSTKTSDVEWLLRYCAPGARIGFDPRLTAPAQYEKMKMRLTEKGIGLVATPENLVDKAWGTDRPPAGQALAEVFPTLLDGQNPAEKIAALAKAYADKGAAYAVVTLPDSIAWLLNIRGNDVECNPYVLSTAILDTARGTVEWFVDPAKILPGDQTLATHLAQVVASDPARLYERLAELEASGKKVALDYKTASLWYKTALGDAALDVSDIASDMKARKTPHQIAMICRTHVEDGVAVTRFLKWFEEEAPQGRLDEMNVSDVLESFRKRSPAYRGPSFSSIVGAGPNGAIVHYHATASTNRPVKPGDVVLVDSGGQYWGKDFAGTTDITRTLVAGDPTHDFKHDYTRVMQAHIAVARARFAPDTSGVKIDDEARGKLMPYGLNYAHGTGHGVGQYLSVHEESPRISPKEERPFFPGILVSNEPGYYKEGAYGIRTENLIVVNEPDNEGKLSFETVTYVPFDPKLIDFSLLDQDEKEWLADYHRTVQAALEGHPAMDGATQLWLADKTAAFVKEAQMPAAPLNFNEGGVGPSP